MKKEDIIKKLDWEWEIFEREMLGRTKENIFTMSDMITGKRQINQALHSMMFTEKELALLDSFDNILDWFYMKLSSGSHGEVMPEEIHRMLEL